MLRAKTEQSETLRKEYDAAAEIKLKEAVENAISEAQQAAQLQIERERQTSKLELDKARQTTELEVEKAKQTTELETERLRREATASKESEKQLRKQLSELLEELSKANKAREDAELTARKELLEKEKGIRAEAAQKASEDFNTKIREQEETINRLREQLITAKQVAEQGVSVFYVDGEPIDYTVLSTSTLWWSDDVYTVTGWLMDGVFGSDGEPMILPCWEDD